MKEIKNEDFDILVFPEYCFTPFSSKVTKENFFSEKGKQLIIKESLKLSEQINKAVVISLYDNKETYFSIFANHFADKTETKYAMYAKNTMTGFSPFDLENYENICLNQFPIIDYKGYKIGLTICNDGNHAPFSRMYGLQQVDLLLNSSGGGCKIQKMVHLPQNKIHRKQLFQPSDHGWI